MSLLLSKRQLLLLLGIFITMGLAFFVLYSYILKPMHERIEQLQQTLSTEQQLLDATREQTAQQETEITESVVELQKRVPVKPMVEQLLLDLERAEVVSDSFISSISFTEDSEVTTQPSASESDTDAAAEQPQSSSVAEQLNTGIQSVQKQGNEQQPNQPAIPLPNGLKSISATLTVQSPTYYHLERFLETLEGLKRIVSVQSLSFAGNQEVTSAAAEIKPLTYSLTVAAFYYPSLADLQDKVPPLDVPPPSEKRNPLTEMLPHSDKEDKRAP
ncbi:type IV pilus assembly protein PilO [Anoxybacillus vitaminiphilus]|jgi:type IV pilus assembly protein PilO|uniref:Type IV pilus assembly protein PilO n=1 Tax=Paranoxybacillus vitaminiphilus TaxID=581036 RepID=A0A327YK56_9BACL|nr:pilus assembly protein PilO [Anoxybacillus vitaminiphilus]RAK21384.1 type IV pilus assembly protein PilO [Anoxybacillus vitaminiphilus]